MNLFRWIFGLPLAAIVTLGLFVMMTGLIRNDVVIDEGNGAIIDPITRQIVDTKVDRKPNTRPDKIKETPPEIDTRDRTKSEKPGGFTFDLPTGDRVKGPDIIKRRIGTPIIKTSPPYPEACRSRGAEGVVLVQYDITDRGEVTNVRIISSDNSCFDRTVIKTIMSWKYPPEAQRGLVQKFVFSLDQ